MESTVVSNTYILGRYVYGQTLERVNPFVRFPSRSSIMETADVSNNYSLGRFGLNIFYSRKYI